VTNTGLAPANQHASAFASRHGNWYKVLPCDITRETKSIRLQNTTHFMEEYMANRCFTIALFALLATLLVAAPALAQNARKYAVLPFSYNGPDKFKYFPKAFQASLDNDLEWGGHVEPTDASLSEVSTPNGKAGIIKTIADLGVDYLITGTITIIDKDANLEIEATGSDGSSWQQKGQMKIDEITPWLDAQANAIQGDVFNRPGYGTSENIKSEDDLKRSAAPTSSAFISASNGQYTSDTLNPQFRYEGGTENIGRWRSQTLRFSSYSMLVLDGDGDGKNEVFILQKKAISAFRFKQGKMEHLDTFELAANLTNIRLEAADLDRDGNPEFVVGAYQVEKTTGTKAPEGDPRSSILSFKNGKFSYVVKKFNRFLGVLRIPPAYTPILVAQKKGQRDLFDKHISEAYLKGGSIELGQRIQHPPYGNVYNMTYLPQEMGYNYVVINNKHRIVTYSQTFERLNESNESYNSSGIAIVTSDRMVGMGQGVTDEHAVSYNIPFRMVTATLSSKSKHELLVNRDLSAAAQLFEGYTYFTQGEIHSMVWDGVGLNLAWKTRRIKGQVSDIAIADMNNDGKKQLCVLINTFAGIGYGNRKTVVLAYDLQTQ